MFAGALVSASRGTYVITASAQNSNSLVVGIIIVC